MTSKRRIELDELIVEYTKEFRDNIKEEKYRFSWDRMVDVIEDMIFPSDRSRRINITSTNRSK